MELFCELDRQETSIVLALRPSQTLIKVFHMAESWLLFLVYDSQNGCTSLIKKDWRLKRLSSDIHHPKLKLLQTDALNSRQLLALSVGTS